MENNQKRNTIKILVSIGMVLCIVITAFFSGYYYHTKISINDCNEFINENYFHQINEFNKAQSEDQYKFNFSIPKGEINET